jgi:hypothetical protein
MLHNKLHLEDSLDETPQVNLLFKMKIQIILASI